MLKTCFNSSFIFFCADNPLRHPGLTVNNYVSVSFFFWFIVFLSAVIQYTRHFTALYNASKEYARLRAYSLLNILYKFFSVFAIRYWNKAKIPPPIHLVMRWLYCYFVCLYAIFVQSYVKFP